MRKAAEAEAALKAMGAASKSASDQQLRGEQQVIDLRKNDIDVLRTEGAAFKTMGEAAKTAMQWTDFGGRTSMEQHLSDMRTQLSLMELINRQQWLLFTSPQAAYAWRERERQQAIQMRYAEWGPGITTADGYITYLQKEKQGLQGVNEQMLARAGIYNENADAALRYYNALSGTHMSLDQLAEGGSVLPGIQTLNAALAGLPDQVTTVLNVDDTEAMARLAAYRAELFSVPKTETTTELVQGVLGKLPFAGTPLSTTETIEYVIEDAQAKGELSSFEAMLARYALQTLTITADFDDMKAKAEIAAFVNSMRKGDSLDITEHLIAAGGTGETGPPASAISAWEKLLAAQAALQKQTASTDATLADAYADWTRYAQAEDAAGTAAARAIPVANELAAQLKQLALNATSGGDQAKYMSAQMAALSIAGSHASDASKNEALQLLAVGAASKDASGASSSAWAASQLLSEGLDHTRDSSGGATQALGQFALGLLNIRGVWGLLTAVGIFGTGLWHILLDAIIETVIMLSLATIGVLALAAAVGIFVGVADIAQDTLGRVSDRLKAVYTAASATGQAIYPLGQGFDYIANVIRPEVWELYGDALNLVGGRMGLVGNIAEKTGAFLDQLAGKIFVFINNPAVQHGFDTLIKTGVAFAEQFGRIFLNLGTAIYNFIKAAQLTHIADDLLEFGVAVSKIIALVTGVLPTWLLALALGLHGIYLWGGLAASVLIALLDPLRAAALAMGGVAVAGSRLSLLPETATGMDKLKAVVQDIGSGFGALPGRINNTATSLKNVSSASGVAATDLSRMEQYATDTGVALSTLVPAGMTAKVGTLSKGLDEAGTNSLNLAAASGATGAGLEKLAGSLGSEAEEATGAATKTGLFAGALSMLTSIPWEAWVAVGVIALAALITIIVRAHDAVTNWVSSMQAALAKTSAYTAIYQTMADLAAVTKQLGAAQKLGVVQTGELSAAQTQLSTQLGNELVHVSSVAHAYGTTMPGALNLLQVAQVSTGAIMSSNSKTWAAALVQVQGLVRGYAAMGQGLTQLQGDVSVQLVMNADQLAAMAKLNTAWDSWLTLVTGGQSAFVQFQQTLATTNTDLHAAGASMLGLNANSLTLQASWQTLVTQGGTVLDNIRSQSAVLQNGAEGTALLNRATKDLAAEMIPLAGNSSAAQASLLALVQEADPSVNTWQKLTQWVGPLGAAGAATDLQAVMLKLEKPVSDLSADAAKLTTTLQQDLNPAMAQATFNALGGQKAFDTFAADLGKFGPNSQQTITAGKTVATMLLSIDKNSKTAGAQFIAWAESMGMTAPAATKLWAEVSKGAKPLKDVQDGLAGAATGGEELVSNGFWGTLHDKLFSLVGDVKNHPLASLLSGMDLVIPGLLGVMDKAGHAITGFFGHSVPDAIGAGVRGITGAWDTLYTKFMAAFGAITGWFTGPFMSGFATPLINWFTQSLPHGIAAAWDKVWSELASPVARAFDAVKHAISSSFDSWWKTHGDAVQEIWNNIWQPIASIAENSFNAVKRYGSDFFGWIGSLFGLGGRIMADIWTVFAQAGAAAWAGVKADALAAWVVIRTVFDAVAGPVWRSFTSAATQAWDWVKAGAQTAFAIIKTGIDALALAFKVMGAAALLVFKVLWAGVVTAAKIAWDTIVLIVSVVIDLLTGHWSRAWDDISAYGKQVFHALADFFETTFTATMAFFKTTWTAVVGFAEQFYNNVIDRMWQWFDVTIVQPFLHFFTVDIPSWWDSFARWAKNTATAVWNSFWSVFISPVINFFSNTVPHWFDKFTGFARDAWKTVWNDFTSYVLTPMEHWFDNLPTLLSAAFKRGVDDLIVLVNDGIHLINDVTGVVKIPKIPDVGKLAAGGDVSGAAQLGSVAGAGEHDSQPAMLMPGEWVVRKPARMALEAQFGPGVMNQINTADTALGSGSRGTLASQGWPGFAVGGGFLTKMASGGQAIAADAMKYGGAGYVLGGADNGVGDWDCSSFVSWVLGRDLHMALPVGGNPVMSGHWGGPNEPPGQHGPTAEDYRVWQGAGTVGGGQQGDLLAFPTHIGIVVAPGQMMSALGTGIGTQVTTFAGGTPTGEQGIFRRVSGVGAIGGSPFASLIEDVAGALSGVGSELWHLTGLGLKEFMTLIGRGADAVFDYLWNKTIGPISAELLNSTLPGRMLDMGLDEIKIGIDSLLKSFDTAATSTSGVPATSGDVASWLTQALADTSSPMSWLPALEWLVSKESGGNPKAIDPILVNGEHAEGLLQTLPSTYSAFATVPGGIWNPVSNAVAAIRYIKCMPVANTEILTKRGWLPYTQVRVGDETLGYNPAAGRSQWTRITRLFHGRGEVTEIGTERWRVQATPNHRWWSDSLVRVRFTGGGQYERRGKFVETRNFTKLDRIRLAAPADTDGLSISPEEAAVIGWIAGDGTIAVSDTGGTNRRLGWDPEATQIEARIYQAKPRGVEALRKLLSSIPHVHVEKQLPPSPLPQGGKPLRVLPMHSFRLKAAWLRDVLRRARVHELGMEGFVLALDPEQRAAWLDAIFMAEGRQDESGRRMFSQNAGPVLEAIKLAIYLEGRHPTCSARGRSRSGKDHQAWSSSRPHITPQRFKPPLSKGEQEVWCPTTVLGTWTARQGEHIFLTGNSQYGSPLNIPGIFVHDYGYADGGPVPGNGDEDSQMGWLKPGEWVVRKPARMALEQQFGPDVMNQINRADQGMAAGGKVDPVVGYGGDPGGRHKITKSQKDRMFSGLAAGGTLAPLEEQWPHVVSAWNVYANMPRHAGVTTPQWEQWKALEAIITFGAAQPTHAWLNAAVAHPADAHDWTELEYDIGLWGDLLSGKGEGRKELWPLEHHYSFPKGYKAGEISPSSYAQSHFWPGKEYNAAIQLDKLMTRAQAAAYTEGTTPTGNPFQKWAQASATLQTAWNNAYNTWTEWAEKPMHKGVTQAQWQEYRAFETIAVEAAVKPAMAAYDSIVSDATAADPASAASKWTPFRNALNLWQQMERGGVTPRSLWKYERDTTWPKAYQKRAQAGDIPPEIYAQKHWWPGPYGSANLEMQRLQTAVTNAKATWDSLYGPGGSGLVTPPPGRAPQPGTGGKVPNLMPYATQGGPANPVESVVAPDMGFSGGGTVHPYAVGGPVSLGDVASMFGVAMASMPGVATIPPAISRQLSGVPSSNGEPPRTMSEAGSASRIGVNISGNYVVNNPVPEKPSVSIAHANQRLAFLAGRDVA